MGPETLLLQFNSPYGPFPTGFSIQLKSGYSAFIGKNNSGKSALLQRAFLHFYHLSSVGPSRLCYIGPDRQYIRPYAPPPSSLQDYNYLLLGQIGNSPRGFEGPKGPDASALYSVCLHRTNLVEQLNELNTLLARMGFESLVLGEMQAVLSEKVPIYSHGSGIRCVLPILAAITAQDIKVVIIDEPEMGLEARAQKVLMGLLREAAERGKLVMVATQSHLFIDKATPTNNFLVEKTGNTSSVRQLIKREEFIEAVYNLLGNSLEDLLFPSNFLIVEGSSDKVICEKVLELLGISNETVKIISARGIDNASNTYTAIENMLTPLVASKSPYAQRIVVLLDKPTNESAGRVNRLQAQLKERCVVLDQFSIEEYVSKEIYEDAGRDREADLGKIDELTRSAKYGGRAETKQALWELKRQISTSIASILKKEHLEKIPLVVKAVELAAKNGAT